MAFMTKRNHSGPTPKFLVAFTVTLLFATGAMAGGYLEPEGTAAADSEEAQLTADHNRVIAQVLKDAFVPDVTLRAVITNPLTSERAVGLRTGKHGPEIFVAQSSRRLLDYAELDFERRNPGPDPRYSEMQFDLPGDPAEVKVSRCAYAIGDALAAKIETVWDGMLRQARPPQDAAQSDATGADVLTIDGTTFHFWKGGLTGVVYSPDATASAAALVAITDTMETVCEGNGRLAGTLNGQVDGLLARLQSGERK